jgi:phosphoglycerate dehydrogenase-like enzyme
VIDEAALYHALRDKTIAGAALDVWYDYRPDPDDQARRFPYSPEHPFHELDNVVLSPHRAASPVFDLRRWDEVAEHLRRFIHGEPPECRVDLEREY